ncbi:peptidoglycan DD-metalloendopeptidase family protein [Hellea balneolensis]|uniref:peptidoglycan DD-metalloendopeptidase family protein n=1 Tax=Hellea balneolensis TaxID=287478 RepID=UPI0003F8B82C|nr:peptidoglycan DD-metalloendopeptidase family protein [Hellea balneolensis]
MTHIFDSLGWALLHSLWQGGLAMLAVVMFRGLTKNTSPALRYNFQIICLFGCFAAFLVTFGLYQNGGSTAASTAQITTGDAVSQAASLFTKAPESLQLTSQNISISAAASAPLLGLLWCLGFAFMAARYLAAYMMTRKLRDTGLTEVSIKWQNRFRTLVLNTGVAENVRLYVSEHVSGPLTIGFIKPVVLVPAGFLMGLPREQVEAILLHELAHIRRYDYLVNLMQTAVKTVLFFHPAIHFISKKIDIDREQACDDLAVAQSRNPQALIRGLAALRLNLSSQGLAMAADGKRTDQDTPLMERLKRLVGSTEYQRRPEHLLMPLIATLLIGGIYLSTTTSANAHPEPTDAPQKTYEHAKADKENYRFETKRLNGRDVTVKITEDGRRWVLADGTWRDVDKNPSVLNRLPMAMPQPPLYKNGQINTKSFEAKMSQFEIDMEYFEAEMERYFEENNQLSEREQDRLERDAERLAERAERLAERNEERVEAAIERAEEQRERAEEQRERAAEQREHAAEQRQRRKEQNKRAEKMRAKANKQHANYNQLRETLYGYLVKDGFISSESEKVTFLNKSNDWVVNGVAIPNSKEDKYCKLFADMGIKKSTLKKIELTPGSTHVVNESKNGKQSTHMTFGEFNHENSKTHIHKTSAEVKASAPAFMWPTQSRHITTTYGQKGKLWDSYHHGVDFKGAVGERIYASADGTVEYAGTADKWGKRVMLKHASGYQTLYAHMNSIDVSRGQSVKAGDIIGSIGSTGQSTGPHLHFELRKDGQRLDPLPQIK